MKVLIAGATGAIGRALVPVLSSAGHEVVAHEPSSVDGVRRRAWEGRVRPGGRAGPRAVERLVTKVRPDAIVNLLTAIPHQIDPRHLARDFELTNRLRTEGTANLLRGRRRTARRPPGLGGARLRLRADAGPIEPPGEAADEETPLWAQPPKQFAPNVEALRALEQRTVGSGGAVLRVGHLYGPGTIYAADGSFTQQVRAGKAPLVGRRHVGLLVQPRPRRRDRDRGRGGPASGRADQHRGRRARPDVDLAAVLRRRASAPSRPRTCRPSLARLAAGSFGVAYMTRLAWRRQRPRPTPPSTGAPASPPGATASEELAAAR